MRQGQGNMLAAASGMSGTVLVLALLGHYLDQRFGWPQYGVLTGALLGAAVGMYELYKSLYGKRKDDA